MGFTVRLLPSERRFTVEPGEPILDAALRAGLDLSYNCASGTCGECKARILSGQVGATRFHDYTFSESEKQQGYVLLCSTCAGSDMTIEVAETTDPAAIPHQHIDAKISHIEPAGEKYLLLSVRTPRSRTLRFLAGQVVELGLPGGPTRRLAVGSCPCNGMVLQFHLSHELDETFISYLLEHARAGSPVTVDGPYGRFTLDEESQRPLVMVAWGTGFAPIKSVLEHAVALEMAQPMWLFWFTEPDGHYLTNYIRSLVDALDDFVYVPGTAEEGDPVQQVVAALPDIKGSDLYLASADTEAREALSGFVKAGVPRERIFLFGG